MVSAQPAPFSDTPLRRSSSFPSKEDNTPSKRKRDPKDDGKGSKRQRPSSSTEDRSSNPPPLRPTRFRFKEQSSSIKRKRGPEEDDHISKRHRSSQSPYQRDSYRHNYRSHSHNDRQHHRHRRRPPTPSPQPSHGTPPLSPDAAFRESLFDALADDEGAAYWEGVYGQPIHGYSRYYQPTSKNLHDDEEVIETDKYGNPVCERMDDDTYAAYVQRKMWENSRAGLQEEQERREKAKEAKAYDEEQERREKARKSRAYDEELKRLEKEMHDLKKELVEERIWNEAFAKRHQEQQAENKKWEEKWAEELKRGQDRKRQAAEQERKERERQLEREQERKRQKEQERLKKLQATWQRYEDLWLALERMRSEASRSSHEKGKASSKSSRKDQKIDPIPWPTLSGASRDVSQKNIEAFFRSALASLSGSATVSKGELLVQLKKERVRWHPDKMKQRYGKALSGVDGEMDRTMAADVTAVFQIIDRWWGELKGRD